MLVSLSNSQAAVTLPTPRLSTSAPRHTTVDETIQLGNLTIRPTRRMVTVHDQAVWLTPSERALLTALARNPDHTVSREELTHLLWNRNVLGESRALDIHVRRLRAKLEPFGTEAPTIVTVRGVGYMLTTKR